VPFPRHTLADADRLVADAGFASTSVDAAERCVACRRLTRRKIVDGVFYCPAHARQAIAVARRVAEVEAIADAAEPAVADEPAAEVAAELPTVEGEFRQTEHGLRYLTADEVAAESDRRATAGEPVASLAELEETVAALSTSYRKVGEGLYEVVLDGTAIGRVARTTPAHVTFGARWASYRTNGERIASGSTSRTRAGERVVEHARFATVDADTITNRRDLLAAVEVQTRHLGYASAAAYLQAPGREVTRARAEVAAYAPDGPAMPAGVGGCDCSAVAGPHLAHCDDCSAPADACVCDARELALLRLDPFTVAAAFADAEPGPEVDDPREQPEPVEWSSIARPAHVPASVPDAEVDRYLDAYPYSGA
jgi:hypothetical protein